MHLTEYQMQRQHIARGPRAQTKNPRLITAKEIGFDLGIADDRAMRAFLRRSPFPHSRYKPWRFTKSEATRVKRWLAKARGNGKVRS
jgi:hypothetical protein